MMLAAGNIYHGDAGATLALNNPGAIETPEFDKDVTFHLVVDTSNGNASFVTTLGGTHVSLGKLVITFASSTPSAVFTPNTTSGDQVGNGSGGQQQVLVAISPAGSSCRRTVIPGATIRPSLVGTLVNLYETCLSPVPLPVIILPLPCRLWW